MRKNTLSHHSLKISIVILIFSQKIKNYNFYIVCISEWEHLYIKENILTILTP